MRQRRDGELREWPLAALLGLALFALYMANGRAIGAGDVVPATLLPVALVRGDGPVLDRFERLLRTPAGAVPGYAEEARGHIVPRYPIGPALVAAPLYAPQVLWRDASDPGWDRRPPARVRLACQRMGKSAAAAIAALGAVAIAIFLKRLGLRREAWPAALLVALGTDHWAVASQALWQHGPAVLCLATALAILAGQTAHRGALLAAGLLCGLAVACRPTDLVFALSAWGWVLSHHGRAGRWAFTTGGAAVATGLLAYNLYFFDVPMGGYAAIEQMHPWAHGTRGTWTTPFLEGASGTLLSPSHGLFVYAPWVAFVLAVLPWSWTEARRDLTGPSRSLAGWTLAGLLPTFVLLSKYSCWWGGHCYGPRFWIDAGPALALAAALALRWAFGARARTVRWLVPAGIAVGFVAALAIQTVGFLCYPSTWHGRPTNADRDHARLWDWRDSEVTRGLSEGIKPRLW